MPVSDDNSKGVGPNISLIPIKDCANCSLCKKKCYALKSWRRFAGTRKAWSENSRMAHNKRDNYFHMVWEYLLKKWPATFRWHVAGDILDQDYYDRMVYLAEEFTQTKFLCFTKRFDLNFDRRPDNLAMVFSRWPGDERTAVRPERLPNSWVQDGTETRIPEGAIKCTGRCDQCFMCWHIKAGKDGHVYFNIH